MQKQIKRKINKQAGAAMLISVIFFLFISLAIIFGLVSPTVRGFRNASVNLNSKQAYFLAESGSEDATYRTMNNMAIDDNETIILNGNSATTTLTTVSGGMKQISTLADVFLHQRKINVTLSTGVGMHFNYGMQVGNGGLIINYGSEINGSVYVNGNITGNNSSGGITGAAIAADRTAEVIDQINDTGTPTNAIQFGVTASTQDGAQSFTVSKSDAITQVSIYIKKVGSPSNASVKITADASGKPATTSLASATFSSSNVTTSYGWLNVPLSGVTLSPSTTYWLVVDTGSNTSSYYVWGANSAQYANGLAKLGKYTTTTWSNTSPSGLDAFFKIYLGGVNSTISGVSIGQDGVGDAWSHTINNSNVAGNIYCQTTTGGNNKSCDTSRGDPSPLNFPVSDAQIQAWKDEALAGGTQMGNLSLSSNTTFLGPKKIVGNLSLSNSAILSLTGVVWVTGTIYLANSSQINLSGSYGSGSGVIISDGVISTANSGAFDGSGVTGSYIMVLTTSTSSRAISIANNAGTVILVAPYGTIYLSNYAKLKEAIGKNVIMDNNAELTYDSGLINQNFIGGPSGSWSLEGWGESQ